MTTNKTSPTKSSPVRKAGRALGEGTGPTGGFLVPKGNTIIKKPKKKKKA